MIFGFNIIFISISQANKKVKKKKKILSSGGICKTSCWLIEEFDRGGKLINVVQF